jgi:hypothetical protein
MMVNNNNNVMSPNNFAACWHCVYATHSLLLSACGVSVSMYIAETSLSNGTETCLDIPLWCTSAWWVHANAYACCCAIICHVPSVLYQKCKTAKKHVRHFHKQTWQHFTYHQRNPRLEPQAVRSIHAPLGLPEVHCRTCDAKSFPYHPSR